ncbi:MAG TPA: tetratricopeptide repeat protein [Flavobacterium sp.]|jgi:tetratricopeptide (TPR) repeat protein|nr:tetratricopeptide repeat protein [Flavobacterium sp.]
MKKIISYTLLLAASLAFAQEKDNFLPEGNEAFATKKYTDAEANYRLSQSKFPEKATPSYNLGNAIYKMKLPAEAGYAYLKAIESAKTRPEKHRAYHNLGNVFMKEKNYTAAVDAYKNALINNPNDEESRYNYALAKKFLKDNPPKKDDKKKDKDKKDKKQDDKSDDKDKGQNDEPKKDPKGDKKEDKAKPKPQPGGISKQRVENLLDAVNNEERKVQDKVKARQVKGKPVQAEKDW